MASPPSPTTSGDDHARKAFKRDRESDASSQQPTTPSEAIPTKKNRLELADAAAETAQNASTSTKKSAAASTGSQGVRHITKKAGELSTDGKPDAAVDDKDDSKGSGAPEDKAAASGAAPRKQTFGFSAFAKGSAFGNAGAGASPLSSTKPSSGSRSAFEPEPTEAPSESAAPESAAPLSAFSSSAQTAPAEPATDSAAAESSSKPVVQPKTDVDPPDTAEKRTTLSAATTSSQNASEGTPPRKQAFGFSSFSKSSAFGQAAAAGASPLTSSKSAFDAESSDSPPDQSAGPFASALSGQNASTASSSTSPRSDSPGQQAEAFRPCSGTTGEEAERTIFSARGRLFEMEAGSQNWKERGTGTIKCNVPNEARGGLFGAGRGAAEPGVGKARSPPRLVMRTEGVLRLILNVILFPGMSVELAQEKFVRFIAFEDGNLVHFAVRMAQPKVAEELFDTIKSRIPAPSTTVSAQAGTGASTKDDKDDAAEKA
ncbi:hypothetical protein CF326_g3359 [Tilletia indica]|nr:hypothetical protein CF326_g3359 [Tilletia indica]